jgi:hypothetical protein
VTASEETEELTPALFDHAKRVYEEMLSRAHKEAAGEPCEDDRDPIVVDIYEGHLTRLFADLNIPNPYYTKIINALKDQNCITQLRRGGGVAMSRWCMLEPPTEESFKRITERKRPTKGKQAILEQRVNDLTRVLSNVIDDVDRIKDAMATSKGNL